MRRLLGWVVLLAGLAALGWWGMADHARRMEARVAEGAAQVAATATHGVTAAVSGRDITVIGLADSEEERSALLAAFNAVEGRRVVRGALELVPVATPYEFMAAKEEGTWGFAGNVPSEKARAALEGALMGQAGSLTLANGEPEGWVEALPVLVKAVEGLEHGTVAVSDRAVTLRGEARTPVELEAVKAVLAGVPAGYTVDNQVTTVDDGTPYRLAVTYEGGKARAEGKLPKGALARITALGAGFGGFDGAGLEVSRLADDTGLWPGIGEAGLRALAGLREGKLEISGDTLSLTGAGSPEGRAGAEALMGLQGAKVTQSTTLYDDGVPFTLEAALAEGKITAQGKLPAGFDLAAEGAEAAPEGLAQAYIPDAKGWFAPAAKAGLAALKQLREGKLSVSETGVAVSGVAATPAEQKAVEQALAALPEGVTPQMQLTLIDQGAEPDFTLAYSAATGASITGKLPGGLPAAELPALTGLKSVTGTPEEGLVAAEFAEPVRGALKGLAGWLPEFESLSLTALSRKLSLTGVSVPGSDAAQLSAALAKALPGVEVTVTAPETLPAPGAIRTNAATGESERFDGTVWEPQIAFTADRAGCEVAMNDVLSRMRVSFLPGKASLDGLSSRTVSAMAVILKRCLRETGLKAEIGGHTDSQGGEALNLELSQKRADSVRAALIARGVPEARLSAVGYGLSQPIASNDTEEGRAQNRRTAVTWTE